MNALRNPWMLTAYGYEFDLLEPKADQVDIRDIAHHLARIRRFNGATSANCSVALHSVVVSYLVHPLFAEHALLHDAHEAYTGDFVTPLKLLAGKTIKRIQKPIQRAIHEHFELLDCESIDDMIKAADIQGLYFERENFMPDSSDWGCFEGVRYPEECERFLPLYNNHDPRKHEKLFLDRAVELLLCSPGLVVHS